MYKAHSYTSFGLTKNRRYRWEEDIAACGRNLVYTAQLIKAADKPSDMDEFQVTFTDTESLAVFTTTYRTGTGHRLYPKYEAPKSISWWGGSLIQKPNPLDVLACLSSDFITSEEMPRDTNEALEFMQSEFGYENAKETLRVVQALRVIGDYWSRFWIAQKVDPLEAAEQLREQD